MRTATCSTFLLGVSLFSLGAHAAWPIKTIDLSEDGALCDTETEQYLQVEGYDFHDHPKFTMTWRQLTGACGAAVDESELLSWEVYYDGSTDESEDDPPTAGDAGRVQLDLFVCCPFGNYELNLDVESYSDEGSTLQQRTAWEVENGEDEYHIWDTVNTDLADDEEYSPTVPGFYTWPLETSTGYYSTLYAGPLPPLECGDSVPSGTELIGCFTDSSKDRLINSDSYVLSEMGEDGMTAQVCSDFCSEYDYFGLEFASECFCGTAEEFESAVSSDQCGASYAYLCTGDATTACGGNNAISIYQKTDDTPYPTPAPTPAPTFKLTPEPTMGSPVQAPTPSATDYSLAGCFADAKSSRIMEDKMAEDVMSAEICFELCNDGVNTHFGTQYSTECWCAVDADLTLNGEELEEDECDYLCAGTTTDEYCGGNNKITAYVIEETAEPEYIGCYQDDRVRVMDAEGKYTTGAMTNEVCIAYCNEAGHAYAGTQYSEECWCGDVFSTYGALSEDLCSYTCEGDSEQMCGGFYTLSVWSTGI